MTKRSDPYSPNWLGQPWAGFAAWLTLAVMLIACLAPLQASNPPTAENDKHEDSAKNAIDDSLQEAGQKGGDCSGDDTKSDDASKNTNPDSSDDDCPKGGNCPTPLGSIQHWVSLALMPNEPGFGDGSLKLFIEEANANLASGNFLNLYGPVWMRIASQTRVGDSTEYSIIQAGGSSIVFVIDDEPANPGDFIVGHPVGGGASSQARVTYVDASGNPATKQDAAYLRQYRAGGGYVEFPVNGEFVLRMVTDSGRVYEFDNQLPIDVLVTSKSDGALESELQPDPNKKNIRQVKSPAGLLDVVVLGERSYEVRKYAPSQITGQDGDGLYETDGDPVKSLRVEAPAGTNNELSVTLTEGSFVEDFDYSVSVPQPGAELWQQTVVQGAFEHQRLLKRSPRDGQPGYRDFSRNYQLLQAPSLGGQTDYTIAGVSYGYLPVSTSQQFASGLSIARARSYANVPWDPNAFGRRTQQTTRDGDTINYTFDNEQRMLTRSRVFADPADGLTKLETYDYLPQENQDVPKLVDFRPRVTTTTVGSEVVSRSFAAYFVDGNGEYVERVEEVIDLNNGYGDPTNRVTEKRFYGSGDHKGRLKQEILSDGTLCQYEYTDNANYGLTITKYERLPLSGTPKEGKSMRVVTQKDSRGWPVSIRRAVYIGSSWNDFETIHEERNLHGKLTERSRTDLLGGQDRILLEQEWDGRYRTRMVDENGIATSYTYNQAGLITSRTREAVAAQGNFPAQPAIVTAYTGSFQLSSARKPVWATRTATTTSGGLTLTETEIYDEEGRVVSRTDENGYTTTTSYSDNNLITTVTQPNGATVVTTRAPDGKLLSRTGTGVVAEYYDYSPVAGGIQTTSYTGIDQGPRYLISTTDALGRLKQEQRPAFGGATHLTQYTYSSGAYCGPSAVEASGEPAMIYEYDSLCDQVRSGRSADDASLQDASATDVIVDSDALHTLDQGILWVKRQNVIYPEAGNGLGKTVSEAWQAVAGFSGNEYAVSKSIDIVGNQTTETVLLDRAAVTTTRSLQVPGIASAQTTLYFGNRLQSRAEPGETGTTTWGYDALGRVISISDPRHLQASTRTYTGGTNQLESETDAAGNTTTYAYGANGALGAGQVILTTRANSSTIRQGYDSLGREIQRWGTATYPLAMGYDAYGQQTSLTTYRDLSGINVGSPAWPLASAGGDTTTWVFEAATGLLIQKQDADGKGASYTYTIDGLIDTRTWARGVVTTYGYDGFNRLTTTAYSNDPTNTASTLIQYDRLGRQTRVSRTGVASATFAYDPVTLVPDSETIDYGSGSLQRTLDRSYDSLLRSSGLSLLNGATQEHAMTYSYDTEGRLDSVNSGSGAFGYQYMGANRRLLSQVSAPTHDVDLAYETNRDHLDVRTNELITFNTVISAFGYTVDSIGRRSSVAQGGSAVTVPGQTITWGYNDRDEVISADHSADNAQDRAYDFDGIGNRLTATENGVTTTYGSNGLNQYTTVGTVNPVHDLDGNATAAPLPADTSANATLTWDGENRLVQITRTDGVVVDYAYDGRGRRVRKTVANGEDRWFVYDGWNLVAEYNVSTGSASASLSPDTVYTWGQDVSGTMQGAGGVGGLLAVRSGTSDYYPLYDGNGNVTEYLDSAGVVVAHYEYDAFGKVAAISGTQAGDFAFQFSTKYADGESGLSYYGFRYYDSLTGRWLSRDPIAERGGWNLYGFVGNQPTGVIDLLGLSSFSPEEVCNCLDITVNERKVNSFTGNVKTRAIPGNKINRSGRIGDWSPSVDFEWKDSEECKKCDEDNESKHRTRVIVRKFNTSNGDETPLSSNSTQMDPDFPVLGKAGTSNAMRRLIDGTDGSHSPHRTSIPNYGGISKVKIKVLIDSDHLCWEKEFSIR
ncbi:MAG: RHS repeat domain-containing protein [Verrucomicrobiales bacterium]